MLTVELLEDTVDGAGATAAAHGHVEFVVVCFRHLDDLAEELWKKVGVTFVV